MEIGNVQAQIESLSGKHVKFSESIIPNASKIYGVPIPELRKLARQIAREDYEGFLRANPLDSFEMQTLQAFVIGYARDDIHKLLYYMEEFLPKIHDWCVNDALCQTFHAARKYPEQTWEFLMRYRNSRQEFEVRVVAVMLLSHFLTDAYIDAVLAVLDGLYVGEPDNPKDAYYAKMGVAWAIATVMAKYPDKCREYMQPGRNHLERWTYNKALTKMRESFRVSEEIKEWTRSMRMR